MNEQSLYIGFIEFGTPEYDECLALRNEVLRKPLGLEFSPEQIEKEWDQTCLAASDESGRIVACLLLQTLDAHHVKMRQVAVAPDWQSKGIGSQLVKASEQWARRHSFQVMELHARDTAVVFYSKLGYDAEGESFYEVGIPHLRMVKAL